MRPGATTPEELETLFEDALLVRDREAVSGLFAESAVLDPGGDLPTARGPREIAALASALWERTFVARPRRVLQARDTALLLGERAVGVARRCPDGAWRYSIALLALDPNTTKEDR